MDKRIPLLRNRGRRCRQNAHGSCSKKRGQLTHTHSHPLTPNLTPTHIHSHTISRPLTHTHTHSLPLTPTHTNSHPLTSTHIHSHTISHPLTPNLTPTHSHPISHPLTHNTHTTPSPHLHACKHRVSHIILVKNVTVNHECNSFQE